MDLRYKIIVLHLILVSNLLSGGFSYKHNTLRKHRVNFSLNYINKKHSQQLNISNKMDTNIQSKNEQISNKGLLARKEYDAQILGLISSLFSKLKKSLVDAYPDGVPQFPLKKIVYDIANDRSQSNPEGKTNLT